MVWPGVLGLLQQHQSPAHCNTPDKISCCFCSQVQVCSGKCILIISIFFCLIQLGNFSMFEGYNEAALGSSKQWEGVQFLINNIISRYTYITSMISDFAVEKESGRKAGTVWNLGYLVTMETNQGGILGLGLQQCKFHRDIWPFPGKGTLVWVSSDCQSMCCGFE